MIGEIQARSPLHGAVVLGGLVAGYMLLQHVLGQATTMGLLASVITAVFILYLVRHMFFLVAAIDTRDRRPRTLTSDFLPSVTVLLPCHNEELVVEGLVNAIAALDYPRDRFQAIFINDKSSDRTGELLNSLVVGHANCFVIHRGSGTTGGKSGGLNAALNYASGQVLVVFDGDHHPRSDCLRHLVQHFDEPGVGAVQGRCVVENPFDTRLSRMVAIDYLCGYLVNMVGRQAVFGMPAYGGANCAIRADALKTVGGWNESSVTEDTDVTLKLVLDGWRVHYEALAIDSEQGVTTLRAFWRQRYRWARGHQQVCRDYRMDALRSPYLSIWEKVETMMFLYVFHVPVLCLAAVALVAAQSIGDIEVEYFVNLWPLIPLMFAGPLLELGGGLVIAGVRRRQALNLLIFPVLYVVSMGLCAKALCDDVVGRQYAWRKTARQVRIRQSAARATVQ
jgi:1,2-diacylglycerol 3-beta-glucosyltransferase